MKLKSLMLQFAICLGLTVGSSFALVDYSDNSLPPNIIRSPKRTVQNKSKKRIAKAKAPSSRRNIMRGKISVKPYFDSSSVDTPERQGKISKIGVAASMKLLKGVSLQADYWQGSSADSSLTDDDSMQAGNPLLKLGFNWFRIGDAHNLLSVDLYGGLSLGMEKSSFASSRTDQIVGLQTSKKMNDFLVMLEGTYQITGNPKNESEMDIGNIRTLSAGIGLYVTNDIRFSLIASVYDITESSNLERANFLNESVSFATISPKLYLQLRPGMNLELGGVFRTKREKSSQDLTEAKLFNISGVYGTGINAGLSISL